MVDGHEKIIDTDDAPCQCPDEYPEFVNLGCICFCVSAAMIIDMDVHRRDDSTILRHPACDRGTTLSHTPATQLMYATRFFYGSLSDGGTVTNDLCKYLHDSYKNDKVKVLNIFTFSYLYSLLLLQMLLLSNIQWSLRKVLKQEQAGGGIAAIHSWLSFSTQVVSYPMFPNSSQPSWGSLPLPFCTPSHAMMTERKV